MRRISSGLWFGLYNRFCMLLQHIVEQLDAELERVYRLRDIVAGLAKVPALLDLVPRLTNASAIPVLEDPDPSPVADAAAPVPKPKRGRPRKEAAGEAVAPRTKAATRIPKLAEMTALTGFIPAGPVVVSHQALAREREKRAAQTHEASQAEAPPRDPESAARDLAHRWLNA